MASISKNEQPLVSIGMMVYNAERFLAQSIESLLSLEYPNFELIISDNASTDRSPEICRAAGRVNRITPYFYCSRMVLI